MLPFVVALLVWTLSHLVPNRSPWLLASALLYVATALATDGVNVRSGEARYPRTAEQGFQMVRGAISYDRYIDAFVGPFGYAAGPRLRAARLIATLSHPGDTLCVEAFAASIYTITGLRCPSRHIAEHLLAGGGAGGTFRNGAWRLEYYRTLRDNPPTFLVVRPRVEESTHDRGYTLIRRFRQLRVFWRNDVAWRGRTTWVRLPSPSP
jgi:hypothetical protein